MKVISKRVDGVLLISLEKNFRGFMYDPSSGKRSEEFDVDSIIKFGVWNEVRKQPNLDLKLIYKKKPQAL